jgi:hypothetical protein
LPLWKPHSLDDEVTTYLLACAKAKGVEVNELISDLLQRDIGLIEAAK